MRIKDSTLLLTGGAGFIGSHVLDALIEKGAKKIVVIDNFNDYYDPKFKEQNIRVIANIANRGGNNANIEVARGDITDFEFLKKIFSANGIDAVIHLAARAGVRASIANPVLYEKVNIGGTQNILELCRQFGVKKLVFASSSSVYGNQQKVPFSESDDVNSPISPYASTKRATELLAYTYHHLFGLQAVGLRFFTVYGERGRPDMAPYLFTEKILKGEEIQKFGDGTTQRDYTYIADIVDGILKAIEADLQYEIINLGNNHPIKLNEFIATIEKLTGKQAKIKQLPMQPGDVSQTYADIAKAKRFLGWEPKTAFAEGMQRFVDWYQKNRQ